MGSWQFYISFGLLNYPDVAHTAPIQLDLTVYNPICKVPETQLDVSGLTDVSYSVGTGPARFVLSLSDNVDGFCWTTWSYQLFINGETPTQITQTSTSDPKLTFDSSAY